MIITKTPFRISFCGGGTDLPEFSDRFGGTVIGTAINKYMYIAINPSFDNKIRLSYSKTEIVDNVRELQHDIVRESLLLVGIESGIEIVSISDIPAGTGLGSSGAFTIGLLHALNQYNEIGMTPEEIVFTACALEIDKLKRPIGKQDQYFAEYGGMRQFFFRENGGVDLETVQFDMKEFEKLQDNLLMFYTGIQRNTTDILTEQKANIKDTWYLLQDMKDLATVFRDAIERGNMDRFGELLNTEWNLKRQLAPHISNIKIDKLHKKGLDLGASGGKLCGAGGGGFFLFYVPKEKQKSFRKGIGLKELEFKFERGEGSHNIVSGRDD